MRMELYGCSGIFFKKKLPQDCSFRRLHTIMESQVIYNQETQIAANPAEIKRQFKFLKSPALIRLLIRQNIRGDKELGRLSS